MAKPTVIEVSKPGRDGVVSPTEWSIINADMDRIHRRTVDVRDHGADVDLGTDAGPAIQAAAASLMAQGGGRLVFGAAANGYLVNTATTIEVSAPLILDLNGQTILRNPSVDVAIQGPVVASGVALGAAVARGDTTLTLADATSVLPGDIFDIYEDVVMETSHNSKRRATFAVRSVTGNVVTLTSTSRMVFSTAASITHYRPAGRVIIRNGTLKFASTPTFSQRLAILSGLEGARLEQVTVEGNSATWVSGGNPGFGIVVAGCVNTRFGGMHADSLAYGVVPGGGSLSTIVDGITALNTRHPVVPSDFAAGVVVSNVATSDCWQTIDSHPAFDVHWSNVEALRDETMPNLRAIGGSITNATIHCDATDADSGPYYQSTELTDLSWYDDAWMTLRDVTILAPGRTTKGVVGMQYGHGVLENVRAFAGLDPAAPTFANTLESLTISNCRRPDGAPWPRFMARVPVRVLDAPDVPVYTADGAYHIDLYRTMVSTEDHIARARGTIVRNQTADPLALTIRIHDNAFPVRDDPYVVFGRIRLTAMVRHTNAGSFDTITREFHVYHKAYATSSVTMPTAPAYSDALTGQANETLDIAVGSVTQAGATELGTGRQDTYIQFIATITSGRTSPVTSVSYELELFNEQ